MSGFIEQVELDSGRMDIYKSVPVGEGPFPSLVVIMNAFGVAEFTKGMCDRFADEGFLAVAPDLFHSISDQMADSQGKTKRELLDDTQIIIDVGAAVEFLEKDPLAQPNKVGITGFCCGGRIAWLMSAVSDAFCVSVPFYGGNLFVPWGTGKLSPFELADNINCPMMFHFGENDDNPSQSDMLILDKELTRLRKDYRFYCYPDAGHAFMDFGDRVRYNQRASEMSWPRTMEFLNEHLKN